MGIPAEFIESLTEVPRCPYCGKAMFENHSKTWCGRNWHYLAIEFRCNGGEGAPPHNTTVRARTLGEWAQHKKKLKFLVTPNDQHNAPPSGGRS